MPILGVIEGFYGRPWSQADRRFLIAVLRTLGLNAYLYAPKSDAYLRREWTRPWPESQRRLLRELSTAAEEALIEFAVGLSPYDLYRNYSASARRSLRARVEEIIACGVRSLALLFDDMPGDLPDLAARQAEITNDVAAWSGQNVTLRVCPTYYSDDPVLDRVFGRRPSNYLAALSHQIVHSVSLFWTGPKVCSDTVTIEHLANVRSGLMHPIALWDNYPVNDSKQRSEHLFLRPFHEREVGANLDSHWSNAMNQMALSLPALASLGKLYGRDTPEVGEVYRRAGLSSALIRACLPLAETSRSELSTDAEASLRTLAGADSLAAKELDAWLNGAYVFDPACLTD